MDAKYEFTDELRIIDGHTLHRIRSLMDFKNVKKGDLGGYIEYYENLDQYGKCWVSDYACVYDDAHIMDDAIISGEVIVRSHAVIKGSAAIIDKAKVSGHVRIGGTVFLTGDATINPTERNFPDFEFSIWQNIWLSDHAYITGLRDFFCLGPVGSRDAILTLYLDKNLNIWVKTGCFLGTVADFIYALFKEHGRDRYYEEYVKAAELGEYMLKKRAAERRTKNAPKD